MHCSIKGVSINLPKLYSSLNVKHPSRSNLMGNFKFRLLELSFVFILLPFFPGVISRNLCVEDSVWF
jgi:hypothetical protein